MAYSWWLQYVHQWEFADIFWLAVGIAAACLETR